MLQHLVRVLSVLAVLVGLLGARVDAAPTKPCIGCPDETIGNAIVDVGLTVSPTADLASVGYPKYCTTSAGATVDYREGRTLYVGSCEGQCSFAWSCHPKCSPALAALLKGFYSDCGGCADDGMFLSGNPTELANGRVRQSFGMSFTKLGTSPFAQIQLRVANVDDETDYHAPNFPLGGLGSSGIVPATLDLAYGYHYVELTIRDPLCDNLYAAGETENYNLIVGEGPGGCPVVVLDPMPQPLSISPPICPQ